MLQQSVELGASLRTDLQPAARGNRVGRVVGLGAALQVQQCAIQRCEIEERHRGLRQRRRQRSCRIAGELEGVYIEQLVETLGAGAPLIHELVQFLHVARIDFREVRELQRRYVRLRDPE